MRVNELIKKLEKLRDKHGDLTVCDSDGYEIDFIGRYIGEYHISEFKDNNINYDRTENGEYICLT